MNYNGMTIEEISDASQWHSRFDEDHRKVCEPCHADWLDFCQEQADDARLDALSDTGAAEV